MTTRDKAFFMRKWEFVECIPAIVNSLSLTPILYSGPKIPFALWDPMDEAQLQDARRMYLAEKPSTDLEELDPNGFIPAKLRWVLCDIPRERGEELFLCTLAIKTDWLDPVSGDLYENRDLLKLHSRIWKELKKNLMFPMWAKNIATGAAARQPALGYSKGAEQWHTSGGKLVQEGVLNVRFEIREPVHVP